MVYFLIEIIKIPTASLFLLIYLFVRMIPQFSTIQRAYQYFTNMLPAFDNVIRLEEECLENSEKAGSGDEQIELRKEIKLENVKFSYRGGEHFTIKDLNLKIPAGKTTAIAGPSGAGKSTVADLVMGLITPEEGKVFVDGVAVTQKSLASWRNKIGYVAQETFLFNETIRFNLLLSNQDSSEKELQEVLKLAAAHEFVNKLPEGMNTYR